MGLLTNLYIMAKILIATLFVAGATAVAEAISKSTPVDIAIDILELATEKNDALAKLQQAETDLNDTLALNEKHEAEIERLSKIAPVVIMQSGSALKDQSFKVGKDEYGFLIPKLNHKGTDITPVEVCADKVLQAELIKMQSGMIYKK